ncbi:RNA-binding protein Hfq [Aneurinibacillus soli]|uniref:RNA-binding protein Hfq n=1 Tax=Aneurinibacillus soli TaxID=1500254 RepID=A0A0U4NHM1_9BACL|nr:RNA chaperone Hfq [Aneurinibacillus soli]PYE64295.1 RNA-binding protein Hfq [Aneurinibacillus soli]BAU28244.1 RNA-binding protein Hfq [Aneurinibacillus soli]
MENKLQDTFLNNARKEKITVTIFLTNGVPMKGRIVSFDTFCILFEKENKQQVLIYKHVVSTIIPEKNMNTNAQN